MKYCTKCGTKLEDAENICPNCGYNFVSRQYENHENDDTQEIQPVSILSRRKKIGMLSVVIVVIAVICFIFEGRSMTSPSKLVTRFESDISSGNRSDLSKILYSNDSRLKIDKNNSLSLISYFKDKPSYLNKTLDVMNTQLKNTNLIKEGSAASQNNFDIIIDGRTLLFFPKYKINVRPTFIEVNIGIKNVQLSLNENKIGKSDADDFTREFGPFIPGEYKLYANYRGKYTSLNKTYNLDLVNSENGRVSVDVFKDLKYVQIDGEYKNAEIFVNNKNSGVKISDAKNFGPVNSGTEIYAVADENGKKLKSDEYKVDSGDSSISLSFGNSEANLDNVEGQIHNLMDMYTTSFCESISYGDFSNVAPYVYPDSSLYKEQVKYVSDAYNKGITEDIESCNVISYTISDDNRSGTVTTAEVYRVTQNDGDTSVKNFKYTYGFKYNDYSGSYQLTSISGAN